MKEQDRARERNKHSCRSLERSKKSAQDVLDRVPSLKKDQGLRRGMVT